VAEEIPRVRGDARGQARLEEAGELEGDTPIVARLGVAFREEGVEERLRVGAERLDRARQGPPHGVEAARADERAIDAEALGIAERSERVVGGLRAEEGGLHPEESRFERHAASSAVWRERIARRRRTSSSIASRLGMLLSRSSRMGRAPTRPSV